MSQKLFSTRSLNHSTTKSISHSTNPPLVSVIMNCLNCAKYLREAIDSVFAQTYTDWEIIFWDNASTDNSAEIAKSYGEKVRYFRSKETVPLGKARNWAIEKARGKYIAFLDCDDVWLPQKLEKQIPLFEKNPRLGLVFCDTIFFNNKGVSYHLYGRKKPPRGKIFRKLLKRNFIHLETSVIRRDVLDNLNEWFDERFNMIEELDLFLRIAYNWEVDYVQEALAKWRFHSESWTWRARELFGQEWGLLLEKYRNLYDDFDVKYQKEIDKIETKVILGKALKEWKKNNKQKVRKILISHLTRSPKVFALYLLSVLPYKKYMKLLQLYTALPIIRGRNPITD